VKRGRGRPRGKRTLPKSFAATAPRDTPASRAFGSIRVVQIGERFIPVPISASVSQETADIAQAFEQVSSLVDAILAHGCPSEREAIRLAVMELEKDWQTENMMDRIRVWRAQQRNERSARSKKDSQKPPTH
jgi:coenzyme F420-reducing hydrogenase gamma subunit